MAQVAGLQILRVLAAIHENFAPGMGAAHLDHVDSLELRHVDELEPVRRVKLARAAGWLAANVRVVFGRGGLAVIVERPRPRLEGDFVDLEIGGQVHPGVVDTAADIGGEGCACVAFPDAFLPWERTQIDPAIRPVGSGPNRPARLAAIETAAIQACRRPLREQRNGEADEDEARPHYRSPPYMCFTSRLFSWHMYSYISSPGVQRMFQPPDHGLV